MRGKIVELQVRIRNLNDLLKESIRYNEGDISRRIREVIRDREKELRILKVEYQKKNE